MVVPGFLQTADYARTRFTQAPGIYGTFPDVDAAVRSRIQRQDMLYHAHRRFHIVITEAALRYHLCPPEVMLGQLDRLITLSSLPAVQLGIIAFDTPYTVAPSHGFWLLDDARVQVETFSAELNLTQPQEIAVYGRVFDALAATASYGRAARAIVNRVVADLDAYISEPDRGHGET